MSLLQQLKTDQLTARKQREKIKATLLTTLISECVSIGKNDGNRETTDKEVIQVIKKFVKNIDETLSHCSDDDLLIECDILNSYLPSQLTEEEITQLVTTFLEQNIPNPTPKDMGRVMKFLNTNYFGQFDGKTVSQLVKNILV